MIWDAAGFHVAKELCVPENIALVRLPPYSPELNPIENLWHYLKSHFWSKPPSTLGKKPSSVPN